MLQKVIVSVNTFLQISHRRAMVLGSFQCRGVLLLWHMVGQGPAVLSAGVGQVGCLFSSRLSHLPFLIPHHVLGDG